MTCDKTFLLKYTKLGSCAKINHNSDVKDKYLYFNFITFLLKLIWKKNVKKLFT